MVVAFQLSFEVGLLLGKSDLFLEFINSEPINQRCQTATQYDMLDICILVLVHSVAKLHGVGSLLQNGLGEILPFVIVLLELVQDFIDHLGVNLKWLLLFHFLLCFLSCFILLFRLQGCSFIFFRPFLGFEVW